jgi:hypothetical protein
MAACASPPPLAEPDPGHQALCWLYAEPAGTVEPGLPKVLPRAIRDP